MTIKIEHPKIESLEPTWAPFAGWSLIFMPFGTTDAENDMLTRLRAHFVGQAEAEWRDNYQLCPLPPDTYHVSFCDLINQGNKGLLASEQPGANVHFDLTAMPPHWLVQAIEEAGLADKSLETDAGEFAFSHVTTSQGRMLGVALEPTGTGFKKLLEARARLQESLFKICRLPRTTYVPHITLGYFPNRKIGTHADREAVPAFQKRLEQALVGTVARFRAIGLYTFTDMISYQLLRKLCSGI